MHWMLPFCPNGGIQDGACNIASSACVSRPATWCHAWRRLARRRWTSGQGDHVCGQRVWSQPWSFWSSLKSPGLWRNRKHICFCSPSSSCPDAGLEPEGSFWSRFPTIWKEFPITQCRWRCCWQGTDRTKWTPWAPCDPCHGSWHQWCGLSRANVFLRLYLVAAYLVDLIWTGPCCR